MGRKESKPGYHCFQGNQLIGFILFPAVIKSSFDVHLEFLQWMLKQEHFQEKNICLKSVNLSLYFARAAAKALARMHVNAGVSEPLFLADGSELQPS